MGRNPRTDGMPTYKAVCEVLHANGFARRLGVPGVDGTAHGERRRAHFVARNDRRAGIDHRRRNHRPGTTGRSWRLLERPLVTVERVRVCKREGVVLTRAAGASGSRRARKGARA